METNPIANDPNPIHLTPTQIDNYLVRPEDFKVRKWDDPLSEAFHGQGTNDAAVEQKSNEQCNRGSARAEGDVNHAGRSHTKQ